MANSEPPESSNSAAATDTGSRKFCAPAHGPRFGFGRQKKRPDLDNRNRQLGVLRLTDATIAQSFSKN